MYAHTNMHALPPCRLGSYIAMYYDYIVTL